MPSLRELLMGVRVDHHGTALFLEALVEAVEALAFRPVPQKHTCSECEFFKKHFLFPCRNSGHFYIDYEKTTPETPTCERIKLRSPAPTEPEDTELLRAKAEIESLRKEYDTAKDEHEEYKMTARSRAYRLRELADLGQMVLGMRVYSRLSKQETVYCASSLDDDGWNRYCHESPAEALRAIQEEESDAE